MAWWKQQKTETKKSNVQEPLSLPKKRNVKNMNNIKNVKEEENTSAKKKKIPNPSEILPARVESKSSRSKSQIFRNLILSLKDKNSSVRSHSAWALGQMGDHSAIEPLLGLLKDKNIDVKKDALAALKRLGWKPKKQN